MSASIALISDVCLVTVLGIFLTAALLLQTNTQWSPFPFLVVSFRPEPLRSFGDVASESGDVSQKNLLGGDITSKGVDVDGSMALVQETTPWNSTLVVVPAVFREWNAGWPEWTGDFTVHLYQRTNASAPKYCPNRGYESAVYLKFIVDHYENLPDITAFVHAWPDAHQRNFRSWLRCLRPGLKFSSLNTATWLKHWHVVNAIDWVLPNNTRFPCQLPRLEHCFRKFAAIFGINASAEPGGAVSPSFYCCNQFVISRENLQRYPVEVYRAAYELVGVRERCAEGPIDPRENWALRNGHCLSEPPSEWFEEGLESKIMQAMPLEYLAHVIFNDEPLESDDEPYDQEHYCRTFLSAAECPGSPCEDSPAVD